MLPEAQVQFMFMKVLKVRSCLVCMAFHISIWTSQELLWAVIDSAEGYTKGYCVHVEQ